MFEEKLEKEEILLAFNHDAFAKKCQEGLVDDKDFYDEIEENERKAARSLRVSFSFVVREL